MRNQILSKLAKSYFEYKNKYKHLPILKDGKARFDLAEGLWLKDMDGQLPDKNHTKVKAALTNLLGVKTGNISVFAGADEIIEIIPRLYLNQEDVAIVVVPVFERLITSNIKVGAKVWPFKLSQKNKFRIENSEVERLIRIARKNSAKLVWLCSPNNPTGQIIKVPTIEKITKGLPNSLIIINEVYQEYFSFDRKDSAVSLINKNSNIIVIRSFSKAFGLAGARIGYVVANPKVISHFETFKTMYNPSTYAQRKAVSVLAPRRIGEIKVLLDRVSIERERLTGLVKGLSNFEIIDDSRTNFLFLRHKKKDIFKELYRCHIVVGDWRKALGVEGERFVRISVNTPTFNNKLIKTMERIN